MKTRTFTDVIVIGGGLSGLVAAHELMDAVLRVTVLEARDRCGGRIQTTTVKDGLRLDLGAQWIGPHQDRIQALIRQFDIQVARSPREGATLFDFFGKPRRAPGEWPPLSPAGRRELFALLKEVEGWSQTLPRSAPWKSPAAGVWDKESLASMLDKLSVSPEVQTYCFAYLGEVTCAEASEYSFLSALWTLASCGGSFDRFATAEDLMIVGGAQTLVDRLAQKLEGHIVLKSPVRAIHHNAADVLVETHDHKWFAQRVVVAMPPTFAARIEYNPGLPALRDQLTQRVGQGAVIKVISVYPEAFWRAQGLSGFVYNDHSLVRATMDTTPEGSPRGCLVSFISGSQARAWTGMPQRERQRAVLSQLGAWFGPKALEPLDYLEKDWSADPWARGGYGAYFAPGVLTQLGPSLAEACGTIHWAGSETATEWRTYMEGAVESAQRAAAEVKHALAHSLRSVKKSV